MKRKHPIYKPYAKRKSNKVAFTVPVENSIAVDRGIERKIKRNKNERIEYRCLGNQ